VPSNERSKIFTFKKMKKKRPLHRQLRKKMKKSLTGIEDGMAQFFVGGERKIAGFMHVHFGPRWTEEYEKMRVTDLVRRIRDDLKELLARAYPTAMEEWHQRIAPNYRRETGITYESRLLYSTSQSVAEELCRGLSERIISQDKTVSRKAREEYRRLLPQFLERESRRGAIELAFIAKQAASYLEYLSVKRGALMKEIAAKSDLWPVNLGLRVKVVKGEPVREITRLEFARSYLIDLELNSHCDFPSAHGSGSHSPFRLAAEELYREMLMLKHYYFPKVTPWVKRLFALAVPMTKRNSQDWWEVARIYLYERWDKAQEEFKPLIRHLGFTYPIQLSSKTPYESNIKSRVIDNSLKDAFIALARPDL
jgi:hypothetical protein